MRSYYDELKNNIIESLEDEYSDEYLFLKENKDLPEEDVYDYLLGSFWNDDYITGNASGSYYFNSYKSCKHCYNYFKDVQEALQECGYINKLTKFKTFVNLVEDGYLDVENMTIDKELLKEVDEDKKIDILYDFERILNLNFEALDVITRCYFLPTVLWDVLDDYLG